MTKAKIFLILALATAFIGCGKPAESRHLVVLIDVSRSIEPSAEREAFEAIDKLIGRMRRGDKVAVIPITGDAQAEAPGRILRFELPTSRQAYDSDLRNFRVKLKTSLEQMEAAAMANPGAKTDILGAVELAAQELMINAEKFTRRELAILSDFIQEDSELNFMKDKRLANRHAAHNFALALTRTNTPDFDKSATVYLGLLKSKEYAELDQSRRKALEEFWMEYFRSLSENLKFVSDGPGLLERELSNIAGAVPKS